MSKNITVTALAASKKLPVEALFAVGVESRQDWGVVIPYLDETGMKVAEKRRTALAAKDGSFWPRGLPLMAYGLWRLDGVRRQRWLILVEGESDCWVLWNAAYPALGIPGAGAAKTLIDDALIGVDRIDVVIEPDQGGETFRAGIGRRLVELGFNGQVYEVRMPAAAKDPAAMYAENPTTFRERFDKLLAAKVPMEPPGAGSPTRQRGTTVAPSRAHASGFQGGDDHAVRDHLPRGRTFSTCATTKFPAAPETRTLETCGHAPTDGLGTCLYDVKKSAVEWLWPGRLPAGKLAILDGDPGLGKSSLTLDLAALSSAGRPMPGEQAALCEPADVVLLSAEDGLADTIRPRLEAAGADLTRIFALDAVPTEPGRPGRPPVFPDDVDWLYDLVRMQMARLVIIDPLMAFLGLTVNAMNDQNVRRALFPLSRLAEETGAAILVVRHLNKNPQGAAVYRGGGSIGIIGAARTGLLVAQDPDDPDGRLLAVSKSNLAARARTLRYRVAVEAGVDAGAPRLQWTGESSLAADELLKSEAAAEAPALVDALEFLRTTLEAGPVRVPDLFAEAHGLGLTDITLRRAKATLGVTAFAQPTDKGKEWFWLLKRAA